MDDKLIKQFDKWNNENHRNAIENNGVCVWNVILTDLPFFEGKQPRISVVFSRYQGNNVNTTTLMNESDRAIGFVLAIPSYWLDVDHYLCTLFISDYIDTFINENFGEYINGGGDGSGGNCPVCPDDCPIKPPCPPPPPPRPPFNPNIPPVTPPGVPPAFNDHISPVGPPIMSPPRPPVDPDFNKP